MEKYNTLKIKDLVTIGVFSVIYFVVMFSVGMIGVVPILFLVYPALLGIISGTVIMLFMAKVQKKGAIFILGMISPIIMVAMGHTYVPLVHAIIVMLVAELVRKMGDYKSLKYNLISFAIFNTWICGSLMQMLLAKDRYIEMCMIMGEEYTTALEKLITYQNMALVYLVAIIGGLVGGYLGKILLKKHFERAGII